MAERGFLGRLLGGDDNGDAGDVDAPASGLDAAAAAAAMSQADSNPALARKAAEYFDRQARLVEFRPSICTSNARSRSPTSSCVASASG